MKRAILVVGAPRSGTSVTSHIISKLGVSFGNPKKFIDTESNRHNPTFFELQELNKINDEIFSFFNNRWSNFTWLPLEPDFTEIVISSFHVRINKFIEAELENSELIGLKDPRFCFTLPIWSAALERLGYKVEYVFTNRSPYAIFSSNIAVNEYSPEKNFRITIESILSASYFLRNKQVALVKYESILSHPKNEVKLLCDRLNLESSLVDHACSVVKSSLNHETSNPKKIFKYFESISLQDIDLSTEFIKYREAILSLTSEHDTQTFKLKQALASTSNEITSLAKNLSFSEEKIISLNNKIEHFNQDIISRDEEIIKLTQTLIEREKSLENLSQSAAENDNKLANLNKLVADRDSQLNELYNSTSWQATGPLRFTSHQLNRAQHAPVLIKAAIKQGGGFTPTLKKAIRLYRREGLPGIKHGLQLVEKSNCISLPNSNFLNTISHQAGELLEPRVLIVAELSIPQCTKYRVKQKQEMLENLGIDCTVHSWSDASACISELSSHSLVIFYRVPAFPDVLTIIKEAKRLKIPTFWEVDDLIFDRDILAGSKTLAELDRDVFNELLEGANLYHDAMLACDKGIASTSGLATAMKEAGVPEVYVIENALDQQTIISADTINASPPTSLDGLIRIVYGSGTNTHGIDFIESSTALLNIFELFPHVRLRIIGTLSLPEAYEPYETQIERIPLCSYEEYLNYLAECDINIAPLENYVFNDAKSNIKLLEASALKIPSICSPRSAFRKAITHGKNGFLCDTQEEWTNVLTSLITDTELRDRIASSAYRSVIKTYCPANISNQQLLPLIKNHHHRQAKVQRILSVNLYYTPRSFGGATIVAEETNKILNDKGKFDIYVFTTLPINEVSKYSVKRYEADGVCIFGLGLPISNSPKDQFENPHVLDAFENVLLAVKPDLVHIHSIQGIGVSITDYCTFKRIKYIVTLHDAWWVCGRQFMINRQGKYCDQQTIDLSVCDQCVDNSELNRYRQNKLQSSLKNAAFLLSPSQYFAKFYEDNKLPKDRILINRNGILKPLTHQKYRRKTSLTFAYLGGNTEIKGVGLVKKAFINLNNEDIKLIVVDNARNLGFSSYDENFFKGVAHIEIVPAYSQESIDEFFSSIDVLLFPTQCKESFGLTIREAIARNVWVITTDAGSVIEDINHGKNGFLIPFDDKGEALKKAIEDTIQFYQKFQLGSEIRLQSNQITWFEDQANELAEIYERATQ